MKATRDSQINWTKAVGEEEPRSRKTTGAFLQWHSALHLFEEVFEFGVAQLGKLRRVVNPPDRNFARMARLTIARRFPTCPTSLRWEFALQLVEESFQKHDVVLLYRTQSQYYDRYRISVTLLTTQALQEPTGDV